VWSAILKREKAIYYTMNKFSGDDQRHSLIAEGWCPTVSIPQIQAALNGVTERTGSSIPPIFNECATQRTPPTSQVINKFTRGFQDIVDAYGIATYREVNPGLFTTITFPFLFAGLKWEYLICSHVWGFRAWCNRFVLCCLDGY
jgi:V-type H+-transporting ATPase subunit a